MSMDGVFGVLGGAMIGLGAAILMLGSGRVMGASGIIGGLVDGSNRASRAEAMAFVVALVAVPGAMAAGPGRADTHLTGNVVTVILAGLSVGFGTRLANGCTSGHGVCGISRLSARGVAATMVYMAAGMASVALTRHVLGRV